MALASGHLRKKALVPITYVFDIAQMDGEELPAVPISKLDGADPNSPAPTDSVEDVL